MQWTLPDGPGLGLGREQWERVKWEGQQHYWQSSFSQWENAMGGTVQQERVQIESSRANWHPQQVWTMGSHGPQFPGQGYYQPPLYPFRTHTPHIPTFAPNPVALRYSIPQSPEQGPGWSPPFYQPPPFAYRPPPPPPPPPPPAQREYQFIEYQPNAPTNHGRWKFGPSVGSSAALQTAYQPHRYSAQHTPHYRFLPSVSIDRSSLLDSLAPTPITPTPIVFAPRIDTKQGSLGALIPPQATAAENGAPVSHVGQFTTTDALHSQNFAPLPNYQPPSDIVGFPAMLPVIAKEQDLGIPIIFTPGALEHLSAPGFEQHAIPATVSPAVPAINTLRLSEEQDALPVTLEVPSPADPACTHSSGAMQAMVETDRITENEQAINAARLLAIDTWRLSTGSTPPVDSTSPPPITPLVPDDPEDWPNRTMIGDVFVHGPAKRPALWLSPHSSKRLSKRIRTTQKVSQTSAGTNRSSRRAADEGTSNVLHESRKINLRSRMRIKSNPLDPPLGQSTSSSKWPKRKTSTSNADAGKPETDSAVFLKSKILGNVPEDLDEEEPALQDENQNAPVTNQLPKPRSGAKTRPMLLMCGVLLCLLISRRAL